MVAACGEIIQKIGINYIQKNVLPIFQTTLKQIVDLFNANTILKDKFTLVLP
jgi:hypothetical protein